MRGNHVIPRDAEGDALPGLPVCPYKGREGYSRDTVELHRVTLGSVTDGIQDGAPAHGPGVGGGCAVRPEHCAPCTRPVVEPSKDAFLGACPG